MKTLTITDFEKHIKRRASQNNIALLMDRTRTGQPSVPSLRSETSTLSTQADLNPFSQGQNP